MNLRWRAICQRLMDPLRVVEFKVTANPGARLSRRRVAFDVYIFVLDGSPEPLSKDVVKSSPFAIHTDAHAGGLQGADVGMARELAALIRVEDFRLRLAEGPIDGHEHEIHFQALIQLPTHHITRIPINNCYQIHPASELANVSNIYSPNMVRLADLKPLEQVRVYAMRFVCDAQIWLRCDPFDTHFTHMPLHLFAIDHLTFPSEASRYSTRAVERALRIEFVNPVLQSDLLGGRLSRPIIKARSIQTQQLCLRLYAKLRIIPFNESGSLIAMKGRGQIFF
jgi:hypothetical protein